MTVPTLRSYQLAAGAAVEKAFLDDGLNRLLVKKPTGTGKTVWFAALLQKFERLAKWLGAGDKGKGARMLVIAHREELLEQAREKIERQNPGLMVSIEQADRKSNVYSDVIVASIQTLAAGNYRRVQRIAEKHPGLKVVIVDEAHHAAATTYRTVLAYLGFLPGEQVEVDPVKRPGEREFRATEWDDIEKMKADLAEWDKAARKDRLLIGVTATPNRSDAIWLECVFQTIAYSYGLKQAIDDKWLVPPKPWVIETDTELVDASGKAVGRVAGDFNQRQLAEAVNNARRNQLAVAAWQEHAYDLQTIAFTVDVEHAHNLAEAFVQAGVMAKAVSGKTPREERRQILADFLRRQVKVITNCMVLTEGTDLPLTECILHAKPTMSGTLYEQMTGRGLRLWEGKERCVVIDLVDIARKHSLQTAPVLYGLPPGLKTDGEDLEALKQALDALKAKMPNVDLDSLLENGRLSLAELQAKASTFDVWTIPDLGPVGRGVTMNWIKSGENAYRLQYPWADGVEVLAVEKDLLGHFDISLTLRPALGAEATGVRQRTIARQIPTAEAALALAEKFVNEQRQTASRITDRDAHWRRDQASKGQLGMLRALKVPFRPGILKGEASDLINLAKARGR